MESVLLFSQNRIYSCTYSFVCTFLLPYYFTGSFYFHLYISRLGIPIGGAAIAKGRRNMTQGRQCWQLLMLP